MAAFRREPELAEHEEIVIARPVPVREFEFGDADREGVIAVKARLLQQQFGSVARQGVLDPGDRMGI